MAPTHLCATKLHINVVNIIAHYCGLLHHIVVVKYSHLCGPNFTLMWTFFAH